MDTKLTLKLEKTAILRGKKYARKQHTSLSRIIENYLMVITKEDKEPEPEISPLLKSISGVLKLPENYDTKKEYQDYIIKKYSK